MAFPKIEGFVVTEKLGSGSYSTVYKAYTKVGARCVVAIKCVDKSRLKHSGSAVDNLVTEIRLLKTLQHPHIVVMKDFSWDEKHIFIVTEYCCGGDLSRYIHRNGRIPERQVLLFLQQLTSALKFLRDKGVAHMDLKPHNLLLSKSSEGKYTLKVADFGFAQYMSEDTMKSSVRGSPLYMAPEMLLSEGSEVTYDARVDLWSVGVIMYECLFGRAPYSSPTFKELMDKIRIRQPIEIPRNVSISPGCADLLTRLLQHDPARRITYDEFFAHEYLDLEYMPTKENYEKAVGMIQRAVELDARQQGEEAFRAYCEALRYLVPVVNAESDSARRAALRAKVSSYMLRAEELKGAQAGTPAPALASSSALAADGRRPRFSEVRGCFGVGAVSSNSYDFDKPRASGNKNCVRMCDCTNIQVSTSGSAVYAKACPCSGADRNDFGDPEESKKEEKNSEELNTHKIEDCVEEKGREEKKHKLAFGEAQDKCRIT